MPQRKRPFDDRVVSSVFGGDDAYRIAGQPPRVGGIDRHDPKLGIADPVGDVPLGWSGAVASSAMLSATWIISRLVPTQLPSRSSVAMK
jgi:hypothetical protein